MSAGDSLTAQAVVLCAVTGFVCWALALGWAGGSLLVALWRSAAWLARAIGRRIDRARLGRVVDGAGETLAALLLVAGGAFAVGVASALTP